MKLLIMHCSPPSCHFLSGPNIPLSTLFSDTFNLCSFRSVRDQAAHRYKTTGKIIVSYILPFRFLGRRREDKII
jgi:hypothetical protein